MSSWFKSFLFRCNEKWFYNFPLFQLLMRIHGGSSGKLLSFKQEDEKIQINSNACKDCSAFLLCALLTFIKFCLPLLSLSALFIICLALLCPRFSLPRTLKSSLFLNELFDANRPTQDFDENEEPELCVPSERKTNCLLIDSSKLECNAYCIVSFVSVLFRNTLWLDLRFYDISAILLYIANTE